MSVRIQDFLSRHRKKLVVTGLLIGGTYFAIRYAQKKLLEMQERQTREFLEKTRRLQHFESTERTCNQVIIGMSTELCQAILSECCTDDLLQQLRQNPPNKVELWDEMKIVAFTRITTFIYATSMLVVALRVKLNLLGGYLYRDCTVDVKQINDQLKQQYLSLINHFVHDGGLSRLVKIIKSKVNALMKDMPLQKQFTIGELDQLFWSLQMSINSDKNDPIMKMSTYLLPNEVPEYNVNGPLLQKMFNETLDLLESDDATSICSTNISRGFSIATEAIIESIAETITLQNQNQNNSSGSASGSSDNIKKNDELNETAKKLEQATGMTPLESTQNSQQQQNSNNNCININNVKIALARIIPMISGLTSKGFDETTRPQNLATNLVSFYLISDKLKILGANIYETFSSTSS